MNNPLNFMQGMMKPQEFLARMMANPQVMSNPVAKNAFEMYQKGDVNGVNQLANNLCKERGVDPEEITQRIKSMFGV